MIAPTATADVSPMATADPPLGSHEGRLDEKNLADPGLRLLGSGDGDDAVGVIVLGGCRSGFGTK